MGKKLNILGQRFGRLVVIAESDSIYYPKTKRYNTAWLCECDCGNTKIVLTTCLIRGKTKSCGCLLKELLDTENRRPNKFVLHGNYYIGYDKRGNEFRFDKEDFDIVSQYCWNVNSRGYVTTRPDSDKKKIILHRLVLGIGNSSYPIVDHINHDTSDCRKCNLRIVSYQMNSMNIGLRPNNSSGVTGVRWRNKDKKWSARIKVNYKEIHLGVYNTFEEAVQARKDAEEKYFGEYSYFNSQIIAKENEV